MDLKINDFEGPLDLLLHLIKQNEMDIFDIEIEKITDQYLNYLDKQESMNLEVTSEYLVLAAELLEIKSKLLLPNPIIESDELENIDPREELVNRLLEYDAYKKITESLKEKEIIRSEIYTKIPSDISNYIEDNTILKGDISLDDLTDAFQKFLLRQQKLKPLNTKITENEISISSRKYDIKNILKKKKKISFFELFPIVSKEYVVATFLAILEMAKSKEILITQNETFDDIICEVISNE